MSLFNTYTLPVYEVKQISHRGEDVKAVVATDIIVQGSVQPSSGYTVQHLLEGTRVSGVMKFITSAFLKITDAKLQQQGDLLLYNGHYWCIISEAPHQNYLLPHNTYIIARIKEFAQGWDFPDPIPHPEP